MSSQAVPGRRPYRTEPGQILLLPGNPLEGGYTCSSYAQATGVSYESLVHSPLVSIPVPVYPDGGFTDLPRWEGTRPEMMWHPLMWLPEWVYTRQVADPETSRLENDDEYAVRIALDLAETEMYDAASGTWLDVLALAGLDVDDPSDLQRVRAWLAGAPDRLLEELHDEVDELMDMTPPEATQSLAQHLGVEQSYLEEVFESYDPMASTKQATASVPALWMATWASTGRAMAEAFADLMEGEVGTETGAQHDDVDWAPGARLSLAQLFVRLCIDYLQGSGYIEDLDALSAELSSLEGDDEALLAGPVRRAVTMLNEIADRFEPTLRGMLDEVNAGEPQVLAQRA